MPSSLRSEITLEISLEHSELEEDGKGRTFRDYLESSSEVPHLQATSPLITKSQVQYDIITEPKVCDSFGKLNVPHIVYDQSKMLSMSIFQMTVQADARYGRLEFSFQGASDQSARYEYESGRKQIPSGFWIISHPDRCTTEFTMTLPWEHLDGHNVLGLESMDDSSLEYEISLNVESWEQDKFGNDYNIDLHTLRFLLELESNPAIDIVLTHNSQIHIEAISHVRIGEGVHLDFERSQFSTEETFVWSLKKVLKVPSLDKPDVDILRVQQPNSREKEETNKLFEIDLISLARCQFLEDEVSLVFENDFGFTEVITVTISSSSLCAQVRGPPCLKVPDIEHSESLQHCQNTKHGTPCKVPCLPGFTQSSELTCIDGQWKLGVECSLRYFLTKDAPLRSAWTECSQHNPPAHLAVITSEDENKDIQRVCDTSPTSSICFIGIVPQTTEYLLTYEASERRSDPASNEKLQWIDGSVVGYSQWRSPENVESTKIAYINGKTGLWGQTPPQAILPAVCQVGDCVPSVQESFLEGEISANIRIRACHDSIPTPPVVFATNGCDVWEIPLQTEIIISPNNPNNSTIYHSWMLSKDGYIETKKTFLSQRIDVVDEPPRFTSDVTDVSVSSEEHIDTAPDIQAIDDCDGDVMVQYSQTKSSDARPFVVYREWRAEDAHKQTAYMQQIIRVGF